MPMEKLRTGGTAPELNNEDACSIVPSPPKVTTKSIFSGLAEILSVIKIVRGNWDTTRTPHLGTTRDIISVFMEYSDVGIFILHMTVN